jgi:nitroreductase
MELVEAMRTTPATREFTDEPVADDVLFGLLDAARFAPSGGNRQPWRVIVVKDPATRRAIRDAYVLGWREYLAHVEKGLVPFAPREGNRWDGPAVDLDEARRTPRPNDFADRLDEVPVMLVLCAHLGSLAVTDNGLGRQSIVGGASVYAFAQNILLAARDQGVGGVLTTMACREEARGLPMLGVGGGYALAALIVLGYPAKVVRRLRRRNVERRRTRCPCRAPISARFVPVVGPAAAGEVASRKPPPQARTGG